MEPITPAARQGIRNGCAAAFYILLVAFLLPHIGAAISDTQEPWLGPASALLLFVISALVTGSLVLWQPVKLLVDGNAGEAGASLLAAGITLVVVFAFVVLLALLVP